MEAAAKTWTGEWWTMGGGGTAWDAFAYDAEAKLLYVGTGYTAVQQLTLAELRIGGRECKVIMQAPKNGFFYVLDRLTGELLSADPIARITWASGIDLQTGRPIETPHVRYSDALTTIAPGPGGAHNWQPMSFSATTGFVYIPASESAFVYGRDTAFRFRPGFWNLGIDLAASTGVGRTGPVRPQSEYSFMLS